MKNKDPKRFMYPIKEEDFHFYPLLRRLLEGSDKFIQRTRVFPFLGMVSSDVRVSVKWGDMEYILEQANQKGTLEPLVTLTNFFIPSGNVEGGINIETLLAPYARRIEELREELSKNISFEAQITEDNAWGDITLNNGKLLLRSGKKFIPYRYGVLNSKVVFEKMPNMQTDNLEEAVKEVHELNLMESIVRVKSKKSYSIRETILPYFAYRLIGFNS